MELEYQVTHQDVVALHRFIQQSPGVRSTDRALYMGGLFVCLVPYLSLTWFLFKRFAAATPLGPLTIYGLVALGVWTGQYFVLRRHPRGADLTRTVVANAALGNHFMRTTSKGVLELRPQGESLHYWKAVVGVHEQPEHVFISVGADGYYVVPKRSFLDGDAVATFLAEVEAHRAAAASVG